MKIYDCITFYNEKMLFELRLNILDKYVHKFVVSESLYSHSGIQKKLNFNLNDFPKFKDKIIYIVIDKEPVAIQNIADIKDNKKKQMSKRINSLLREKLSREILSKGIIDADDNDLIMYSDSDEIPNLENISAKIRYRQKDQVCSVKKQNNAWLVQFDEPQRAVTPGQTIAFYKDDFCLGGGEIEL